MNSDAGLRRLRIDRLELDLRGIPPATAEAAAQALAPVLVQALSPRDIRAAPARYIDAGHIASSPSPEAHELAATIARGIARSIRREST